MANTIILKNSTVASRVPNSTDLVLGELAVNTTDGTLFMKKGDNSIVELGSELTASEILAKLLTVDGPGSLLDADTLDGIDSTGFATATQGTTADNAIPSAEKGVINGVATLDSVGKVPSTQLPAIAISETFVVASESAMLGLTAQTGDTAVRTDTNETYILQGTDPSVLGDWVLMLTPTDAVQSVDGRQGVVSLGDLYLGINSKAVDSNLLDGLDNTAFFKLANSNTHSGNITPDISNARNLGASNLVYANVYATTFVGTASTANYADLAENYEADADIEPGTVVCFGGTKEVTTNTVPYCARVAGIISTDPAYTMNNDLEAEFVATVALKGRVPCKVSGKVRKGDLMVSNGRGGAQAETNPAPGTTIGKALQDSDGDTIIEVVVI